VAESPQGTLFVMPANGKGDGTVSFYLATPNADGTYNRTRILMATNVHVS
jgi:hypothetical protein